MEVEVVLENVTWTEPGDVLSKGRPAIIAIICFFL